MANQVWNVANPTAADITVAAKIAKARQVTELSLDDATTEAEQFGAAGCALLRGNIGSENQRQEAAYILYTGESQV